MDNNKRIAEMKSGILHTTMTRDVSESKPVGEAESKGYRWIANSGDYMPGMFGKIRLDIDSMNLKRFSKNPVILYSHDGEKPVGIGDASKSDSSLFMDVFFDEVDELSQRVKAKVDAGTLKAMSVGVDFSGCGEADFEFEGEDLTIKNSELLEASICSVPRDAKALRQYSFLTAQAEEPEKEDEVIPVEPDETEIPEGASEGEEKSADSDSEPDDGDSADSDEGGDTSTMTVTEVTRLTQVAAENIVLHKENEELKKGNEELAAQIEILSEGLKFEPLEKNDLEGLHGLELTKAAFAKQGK